MELELKRTAFDCYETSAELTLTQEESAENIVPDYCPDIARIIDTVGTVYIHSRNIRDGKAEAAGAVQVTVLYIPDGESMIRTLEFAMPFTVQGEGTGNHLLVETDLESIATKLVNPRKVFTRCRLITRLTANRRTKLICCGDVEEGEHTPSVEKRCEKRRTSLVTQLLEKDFAFSDTLHLSPGKEAVENLLIKRVQPTIQETKIIGSKLILKGAFTVELLYCGVGGTCCTMTNELPFSQILEAEESAESAECRVLLHLTGSEFQLSDDGHEISLTLYLHASACLREEKELSLLTDLYSTTCELSYEADPISFVEYAQVFQRRQNVREIMEIGVVAEKVLSVAVRCGAVSVSREGEQVTLRTTAAIRGLYLDEGGVPLVSERRTEVTAQMELPENCQVIARAECVEEMQSSLTSGGIEVRFPVEFSVEAISHRKTACISSVKLEEENGKDQSGKPSVVLRCLEKGECLWDLAKRYSTTGADILAANELASEEEIPYDKLLLIPRKRG